MARSLRIEYPGAFYHVMARGNRREAIFMDDDDRRFSRWGEKVAAKLGDKPNSLVLSLEDFRQKQEAEPAGGDASLRERQKTAALAFLNRKLESIQLLLERRDKEAYIVEEGKQAAALLPSCAVLTKSCVMRPSWSDRCTGGEMVLVCKI